MGLFDQILGAIDNPNQQGNPDQLSQIVNTVQQVSGNSGVDVGTTQVAMSMLGGYVRSALQDVQSQSGNDRAQEIVNQFSGTSPNLQAALSLFSPNQISQIAEAISQRTGIDAGTIQSMIPVLIPVVLNLLKMGSNAQNPQSGSNSLLNSFLDSDGDNDVDIGDAMRLAGRFFNQ